MAALFRATVMLLVLVGLPAAWIYYGPLPPEAMGVIQRTVATAKQSLGWNDRKSGDSWPNRSIAAPKFEVLSTAPPAQPIRQDSQFSLASANLAPPPSVPSPANVEVDVEVDAELAKQLEPHLSLLRALDASGIYPRKLGRKRPALPFSLRNHPGRERRFYPAIRGDRRQSATSRPPSRRRSHLLAKRPARFYRFTLAIADRF